MARGLRLFAQRVGDGAGQPLLDADNGEVLMHVQNFVSIALGNRSPESPGTLYISSKQVFWLSDMDIKKGYAVDFFSVSLHAVSRDPETYPSPCIYCQIETEAENDESEGDDECNATLDISKITEMRLILIDPSQLDALFDIFCECAELNPDPVAEDEEGHEWIYSADQLEDHDIDEDLLNGINPIGSSNGNHELTQNVLELKIDDQRFEDPEEMDSDENRRHN